MLSKHFKIYNNVINISFYKLSQVIQKMVHSFLGIRHRILTFYYWYKKCFLTLIGDNDKRKSIRVVYSLLIKK